MHRFIIFIQLCCLSLSTFCQEKDDTITVDSGNVTDIIVSLNADEYKTYYSSVDLSPWKNLKDSGSFNINGLKEGCWIEFPIDTSIFESKNNICDDSLKAKVYKPDLYKLMGNYKNGKREGRWSYLEKNVFEAWIIDEVIDYKSGLKHGYQIKLDPFVQDTIMIVNFRHDIPIEVKTYRAKNQLETVVKQVGEKCVRYTYDERGEIIKTEDLE
jgi:hypothetical protein